MEPTRRDLAMMALGAALAPAIARGSPSAALIFAQGAGAPNRPQLEAFISAGADFLSVGVTPSQDGVLVALPAAELSAFTDVAARPQFAARRGAKTIEGAEIAGWFVQDFTLAELKTLVLAGPQPAKGAAPPSLLTLQEVIDIVRAGSVRQARVVGVAPRMIAPAYFAAADLPLEPRLATLIRTNGYNARAAAMIVAAADPASLKNFGGLCRARRTLLIDDASAALDAVRAVAEGIGVTASLLSERQGLVAEAHAAGLTVLVRAPAGARRDALAALFATGADAVACDDVGQAVKARKSQR